MSSTSLYALILTIFLVKITFCPPMDQLRASVTRDEQRAFIKLHVLLDVSAAEVHRLLDKAVKSNAMSVAQV